MKLRLGLKLNNGKKLGSVFVQKISKRLVAAPAARVLAMERILSEARETFTYSQYLVAMSDLAVRTAAAKKP